MRVLGVNSGVVFGRGLARASLSLALCAAAAASMPVEPSHPVADFLRRLEEKGVVRPGFWSTLPRDEREVVRVLEEAAAQPDRLGAWDRRRLERYREEFDPERKRGSLLHREDGDDFILHGGLQYFMGIYLRDSIPKADLSAFGHLKGSAQAAFRDWAYLTSSVAIGSERSYHPRFAGENYNPARGLPFNVNREGDAIFSSTVSSFDAYRVVAGVGNPRLRLEAGQDWNQWGPGHWQHATLGTRPHFWVADSLAPSPDPGFEGTRYDGSSRRGYLYPGEGPPLPQVRLRFGGKHWEYVKVVAQRTGLWKDSAAVLVAHRLQLRMGPWSFGATELLAVGGRGTNWTMFLPAIPLKVAEHEGGNRDNASLSVDAEWIWRGHGRLYGEFFLDDFSGPPLDFWGNKFAWTVGGAWHDPAGLPAELRAEYSRVDPWVYGHDLPGTQMQHYGSLLGSSLPPNSHAMNVAALVPLPWGMEAEARWRLSQRDYKSPGSSIFDVQNEAVNGYAKAFLERDVETRNEWIASAGWPWRRHVDLRAGAGWMQARNWRGTASSLSTPLAFGEINLRY